MARRKWEGGGGEERRVLRPILGIFRSKWVGWEDEWLERGCFLWKFLMEGVFLFCLTVGVGMKFSMEVRWVKNDPPFFFFFTFLPSSWLAHLVLGSIFDCLRRRVYKRGFFKSMGLGEIEESISQCKRVKRCDVGENPVFEVMCIHELWAEWIIRLFIWNRRDGSPRFDRLPVYLLYILHELRLLEGGRCFGGGKSLLKIKNDDFGQYWWIGEVSGGMNRMYFFIILSTRGKESSFTKAQKRRERINQARLTLFYSSPCLWL